MSLKSWGNKKRKWTQCEVKGMFWVLLSRLFRIFAAAYQTALKLRT